MNNKTNKQEWWENLVDGFFGEHYIEGDDSLDGYLQNRKQTLEQRTESEVTGLIKLLKLNPAKKPWILDIPCGYGRHSIALAKRGFQMVGVDINMQHLEKGEKDAKAQKVFHKILFEQQNMININYHCQFDALINMFYSFGFFQIEKDNIRVLQNFYNTLKPSGKFLFHTDVNIPRVISGDYKFNELRKLQNGGILEINECYDDLTKRMNGSWTIIKPNRKSWSKSYSVRVYTKEEFIDLCKMVGFKKCQTYSDWDGTPYDESSEDMIIVAKK